MKGHHFVSYPRLATLQLLSLKQLSYSDLIESAVSEEKGSLIPDHPLVKLKDLTENDIVLRQINYSSILDKLLTQAVKDSEEAKGDLKFPADFYGQKAFWLKSSVIMRLIYLAFSVVYLPQKAILTLLNTPLKLLGRLNLSISVKRRLDSLQKCKVFLKQINTYDVPLEKGMSYLDLHLHKQAQYTKFASLVTQLIVDQVLGCLVLWVLYSRPTALTEWIDYSLSSLHIDQIEKKLIWMLG